MGSEVLSMILKNKNYLILFFFICLAGCAKKSGHQSANQADTVKTAAALANSYANNKYNIQLQYPESWILFEKSGLKAGKYAVNIFKRGTGAEQKLPFGVHTGLMHSYVAIWPLGLATELPAGQYGKLKSKLTLNFEINRRLSKRLILRNGTTWAYFIVPRDPPENWSDYGFIYAQVQVKNSHRICYDEQTGKKVPQKRCDFLEGDKVVRTGQVDRRDAILIRHILETVKFKKEPKKISGGDLIEVKQPLPNATVTSPLRVKGKAKGPWYFEGVFTVKLVDASGDVAATGLAKAQENWMTEHFVPFKATLTYDSIPGDKHGRLLFIKANPAGKEKFAKAYAIPVTFPSE